MSNPKSFVQDEFFDSLLSDFLDESSQLLDRLNENLLELDEWAASHGGGAGCDHDLLNDMFRSAHSIKGLSAMLGLSSVNSLTHKIENVFDAARKDELRIDSPAVEVMFQAFDLLVAMIGQLKEIGSDEIEAGHVNTSIHSLLAASSAAAGPASQSDAEAALAAIEATSSTSAKTTSAADASPAATETAAEYQPETRPAETAVVLEVDAEMQTDMPRIDYFSEIADEGEVPAKYLAIFIDETVEALDALTETLLSDEDEGGGSTETLLITSHRIKGSAASVGLNRPAKLAHLMEDILHELRESRRSLTPGMTDAMLGCTDALRQYVEGLRRGSPPSESFNALAHALLAAKAAADGAETDAAADAHANFGTDAVPDTQAAVEAADSRAPSSSAGCSFHAEDGDDSPLPRRGPDANAAPLDIVAIAREKAQHDGPATVGRVAFLPGLPLVGLKARLVYEKLQHLGDVFWCAPPAEQLEELDRLDALAFAVGGKHDEAELRRKLSIAGVTSVDLTPLANLEEDVETSDSGPWDVELQRPAASRGETPSAGVAPAVVELEQAAIGSPPAVKTPSPQRRPADDVERGEAVSPETVSAALVSSETVSAETASGGGRPPEATAPRSSQKGARRNGTPESSSAGKPTETLRVDIERLDQLMNLAGQLVINKARFTQIGDGLKSSMPSKQTSQLLANASGMAARVLADTERAGGKHHDEIDIESLRSHVRRLHTDLEAVQRELGRLPQIRSRVNDLFEAVHQLDRVADGIQQSVMDTRMVPIGPLFGRFKRVIRDITRGNGKDVRLAIRGEKTELDKRMIDELGDPLIHMVRNSADHGIESPERRVAGGKPRQGEIVLDAFHRGNSIYIQVKDDGQGLDGDRILAKALEKEIVTPADAEKLTPHQVHQLIWEPGFSTAEKVTEISGRGMGMDIVRSKIEELNGAVEVESELGRGTTFTIKLPLTLAILPSLMAEIDGEVFALPIESVVEIVSIPAHDLSTVHGLATATIRGRIVSVIDLNNLFVWNDTPTRRSSQLKEASDCTIVVIGQEGRELGLLVHSLLGEEDVVIKSLAENYRNVPGIAGASILGDGRVSLILDVNALIEMSSSAAGAAHV